MIIRLLLTIAMTAALGTSVQPNSGIYEDTEDTTSFNTAYDVAESDLIYAEVFGQNDSYDYIKYTATYTRSIFLMVNVSDNKFATVDMFIASKGLTTPYKTFNSDDVVTPANMTYLKQGDTVYYRVRCTDECYWTGELLLNINPSGFSVYDYEHFNGYPLPHNDGTVATIPFKYDSSVYANAPGQYFTYYRVIQEAMEVWEACGKVDFVVDSENALFTVSVKQNIDEPQVYYGRVMLTNQYYCREINLPGDSLYYEEIIDGAYLGIENPVAATMWDGIMGVAVICIGLSLGISMYDTNGYAYNQMRNPVKPFSCLGDGDIGSFIEHWGDANEN